MSRQLASTRASLPACLLGLRYASRPWCFEGALWLLVHSGSRAMGPAIRAHHERGATSGLVRLDADSDAGRAYLDDASWAGSYARLSRARIAARASEVLSDVLGANRRAESTIEVDHNHVRREVHDGHELWVHRKGAMGLGLDQLGVVPGSMGTLSFHVEGRGCASAFGSSAHGAGRALARGEARKRITTRTLLDETRGVFFDHALAPRLREEAPSAYKDVRAVMRAQRELVRIVRTLRPVLVYKAV
jgi:tRNA-splicing ligase RtcB